MRARRFYDHPPSPPDTALRVLGIYLSKQIYVEKNYSFWRDKIEENDEVVGRKCSPPPNLQIKN